jgi:hypothetical protein
VSDNRLGKHQGKIVTDGGTAAVDGVASVSRFVREIDTLTQRLLRGQFKSAEDVWQFELDLLALERSIQRAIAGQKSLSVAGDLSALSQVRFFARRLGDALAWVLVGLDERVIRSLAANHRVPIAPEEDEGSRAMLLAAQGLSDQGWGFPLVHDITDCLRIGDITFVKPAEDGSKMLKTVEVKARVVGQRRNPDGTEDISYSVKIYWSERRSSEDAGLIQEVIQTTGPGRNESPLPRSTRARKRKGRQLDRMSRAASRGGAIDGQIVRIPGERPLLSLTVDHSERSNWRVLRRVIRAARANGFGADSPEPGILYVAYYSPTGLTEEHIKNDRLLDEVQSRVLDLEQSEWNALMVHQVPSRETRLAALSTPFYLYPIQRYAISDILFNRLSILVIWNPARVVAALKGGGFTVKDPVGPSSTIQESLVVSADYNDSKGQLVSTEIHHLGSEIVRMIDEFRSTSYLVDVARAVLEDTVKRLNDSGTTADASG